MSTNAQRLAQAVRARRQELDLSQLDVWQAGGPSNTTLTEIENGRLANLTRTTAKRLDIGLKWEQGSAKNVWEGGDPVPVGVPTYAQDDRADLRRRILEASYLTAEEKTELLSTLGAPPQPPSQSDGREGRSA